jgi:transcriptional regulator with XRE-family HTH domain
MQPIDANSFGYRLAYHRRMKGLSQGGLAKATRLGKSVIGHYERNRHYPPPDALKALAKALNVSVLSLTSTPTNAQKFDATELEALDMLRRMPKEKHPAMLLVLRQIFRLVDVG